MDAESALQGRIFFLTTVQILELWTALWGGGFEMCDINHISNKGILS